MIKEYLPEIIVAVSSLIGIGLGLGLAWLWWRIKRHKTAAKIIRGIAARTNKTLPKITGDELAKITKFLSNGNTVEEARRYAKTNCPNYQSLTRADFEELAGK